MTIDNNYLLRPNNYCESNETYSFLWEAEVDAMGIHKIDDLGKCSILIPSFLTFHCVHHHITFYRHNRAFVKTIFEKISKNKNGSECNQGRVFF